MELPSGVFRGVPPAVMSPPAPRWLKQWLGHRRPGPPVPNLVGERSTGDPLPQLGEQVRRAREARGLNLRQLANDTRISTTVLEAIERGWRDRLPEGTYLRSMLPLLERRLDLPAGTLAPILAASPAHLARQRQRAARARRFTPGSIDVFTTWQGTVVYGLLTLGLIYGLNLQQRHLAASQSFSLVPLPAGGGLSSPRPAATAEAAERLSQAYPGLRPLSEPLRPRLLATLRRESTGPAADLLEGRLQLQLDQPTRLELRSGRSTDRTLTRLEGVRGELDLSVLPPFELQLEPAPAEARVRWRGQPLTASADDGRVFRYPAAAAPRP